jgi:hypothetical protein
LRSTATTDAPLAQSNRQAARPRDPSPTNNTLLPFSLNMTV